MRPFTKNSSRISLRTKISVLVLLNALFVLILVVSLISYVFISNKFTDVGERALSLAKTVATIPEIVNAYQTPDPSKIIQPLAEEIRKKTGAQFIVVGNMNLIRYSHPDPSKIGKKMVGKDDAKVLKGQYSISQAVGTMGLSIRGKSPVFDAQHHQIGIVSVGFLVEDVWEQIARGLLTIAGLGFIGTLVGLCGAYILSGQIKRQMFNMEPFEIAFLHQEQSAILESIKEGIVAVDQRGKIKICNKEAKRVLRIKKNIIGKNITSIIPNSQLMDVLEHGEVHLDQPMIIENTLVVVNRIPVLLNDSVVGAVASFRDKMELDQLNQRLIDINEHIETLRSQRHEFMNRLHTISGLIQLEEYELAKEIISQVNNEYQKAMEFFASKIQDPAVAGMIIGKMHQVKEAGIELEIHADSYLQNPCPHREIVVTVLGNGIENAIEALQIPSSNRENGKILIYICEKEDQLLLSIRDNGPGIDPKLGNRIFEDGISTKGPRRGFGLSLLSRLVANVHGELTISSSPEGATLKATLPIKKEINDDNQHLSSDYSR